MPWIWIQTWIGNCLNFNQPFVYFFHSVLISFFTKVLIFCEIFPTYIFVYFFVVSDHEEEERRQRERDRRREEKRRDKKKTRESGGGRIDPMDPSSYSDVPR